ncbi:MAG: FKBP-type peptidyl-prolyl cis-trans isomerase [Legionella sp.]|nr:FKBP-type peptidyl-prolyl cis-trans isomerase [Legionella sp.]
MKMKLVAAVIIGLSTTLAQAAVTSLATEKDKLSYSIGADLGKNFKNQGIEISSEAFAQGIQDAVSGGKLLLTEQQVKEVLTSFQKDMMAKQMSELNKKTEENKVKGEAFLNSNKSKPGVVVLPSGLQYKIITAGTGNKPTKTDTVTVEYTGKLIDGSVFDSSEKTGKPATFQLTQVIPGWTEVLQLMPAGSTWEVYIPSNLAYGPRNIGKVIGPNETLIFQIHLVSIKDTAANTEATGNKETPAK